MRTNSFKAVVLLLLALPLLGAPCTEEKIVDVTIGMPTTVLVDAEGSINIQFQSSNINVMQDLDVLGALDEAGIDIFDIDKNNNPPRVAQVFYRVATPDAEPTRTITGASFGAARVDDATGNLIGGNQILISGWSGAFGTGAVDPEEWIDITNLVGTAGLTLLNDYMFDLICALQDGTTMVNPNIRYIYSGTSAPQNVTTLFQYEIKVVFTTTIPTSFEIPFG